MRSRRGKARAAEFDPGTHGSRTCTREDKALTKDGYRFDVDEADRVCNFFSQFVIHHKGRWAGTPVHLELWQRQYIRRLFGWLRPDGTRRYRKSFLIVPRKNGKSTIASGGGLYLLNGDSEMGAEVYALAANKDQSRVVFDEAKRTVEASETLNQLNTVYTGSIFYPDTGSKFMALSGLPRGKHGFNPHGVIIDELHEFRERGAFDAMTTGSAAREQPLVWIITTAGDDQHSLCFEEYDYACKVRDGIIEDPHYLPVIYEAAPDDDWTDEKVWAKANPNLGVSVSIDFLRSERDEAIKKPGREPIFRRFYLNQWVNMSKRWLDMKAWNRCQGGLMDTDKLADHLRGKRCWGGLDLSKTIDLTAFVLYFPDDAGGGDVLAFFWCPEDTIERRAKQDRVPYPRWATDGWLTKTPGNVVDYSFVRHQVAAISREFDTQEIAYDRLFAGQLVQDLQDQDGLTMVEFGQGFVSMAQPTAELERLVTAGKIRHHGNPILRWNASNVVVRMDAAGNMKPDKAKSVERIDGVVGLIMALGRAVQGDGGPSVYEERPLITL